MRSQLLILGAFLAIGACTQQPSPVAPSPNASAQLQPGMKAETDKLNSLTQIAIDAGTLYAEAGEKSNDAELKGELTTLAAHRKTFATNLQKRVAALGSKPAENGQAIGTVHRSFTAVRQLIENDSLAAAGEVYRGESYMIDEIDKVLKDETLTAVSKQLLVAEMDDVKAGRNRVELIQARLKVGAAAAKSKE